MALPLVAPFENVITRCEQEGIEVVEWEGPHPVTGVLTKWRDMTMPYALTAEPTALLNHHTAPPVPYPLNKLADRCNWTIRHPDGAVVIMNAGIAYDSGNGDRLVLAAVREDRVAPAPTDTYNLAGLPAGTNPGVSGTRWYVDCEVQHLGDGSPLLPALRRSLIVSDAALCEALGFNPGFRVIGHREWTKRKIDPRWDGFSNPMSGIRVDTAAQLDSWQGVDDMWEYMTVDASLVQHAWDQGWLQPKTQATLDYFLTAAANGNLSDPNWGVDYKNFRVAVTNGMARAAGDPGPKGDPGPAGLKGATGLAGPKGDPGPSPKSAAFLY